MYSNLLRAFADHVETRGDACALIDCRDGQPVSLTWPQLAAMTDHVAANLNGSCVGYACQNTLADVVLPLACMASNRIEVPLDARLGPVADQLWQRVDGCWLTESDREQLIVDASSLESTRKDLRQRLRQSSRNIDPDSPALVLWTSGTTAEPKGVTLSHRNLIGNAQAKLAAVPQAANDVRLTSLPLCHAYARTCDFGTWLLSGCTLAVGLGFEAWQTTGPSVRPTLANTVPSIAHRLLEADARDLGLDRLRLLGCGGAAMNNRDFQAWRDRGVTVIQGYGLTETAPVICSATLDNATAGLVGQFVDGWEHDIRDGRLFVRGPHLMLGYWNDDQATAKRIDHNGWFDTGDMVEVDASTGQLRILGRSDDVIVLSDGHKVYPQSIEREVESVEGVRHAMVVDGGRRVDIWVDADPDIDQEILRRDVREALSRRPPWERAERIRFFASPLTQEAGELTQKGAIRRARIRKQRL